MGFLTRLTRPWLIITLPPLPLIFFRFYLFITPKMMILLALFILALVLALIEVYLLPGFGITGIGAAITAIAALVLTYLDYGLGWTLVATTVALTFFFVLMWWFSRHISKSKAALQATITSVATAEHQFVVTVGDKGKAISRLALVGNADFQGRRVEVRSEMGFIDEGSPVVVTQAKDGIIYVRALS